MFQAKEREHSMRKCFLSSDDSSKTGGTYWNDYKAVLDMIGNTIITSIVQIDGQILCQIENAHIRHC